MKWAKNGLSRSKIHSGFHEQMEISPKQSPKCDFNQLMHSRIVCVSDINEIITEIRPHRDYENSVHSIAVGNLLWNVF